MVYFPSKEQLGWERMASESVDLELKRWISSQESRVEMGDGFKLNKLLWLASKVSHTSLWLS